MLVRPSDDLSAADEFVKSITSDLQRKRRHHERAGLPTVTTTKPRHLFPGGHTDDPQPRDPRQVVRQALALRAEGRLEAALEAAQAAHAGFADDAPGDEALALVDRFIAQLLTTLGRYDEAIATVEPRPRRGGRRHQQGR